MHTRHHSGDVANPWIPKLKLALVVLLITISATLVATIPYLWH